ncbi:calcium/sodium antiporter [Clostridium sp. Sa3CUN1]|uniref:Calcium/sodium antiporter n=1 Tax=Clostridium gallinarum TaxID=2762246 RepID=A0ABR8Q8F6_9CLOT|nr:calcium/sodium antiporter [Clostridium gallinarum]MBD7916539.1 calcium/sodium antiporter [Clostridium gallinarum]
MSYIILIIGFALLIKGADIFVEGASNIAKKLGIPSIIVGLTIVSLGTSAPELAVSLIASFEGNNGITMGNVLGSNIFNTLMVLGLTAIVMPIIIKKNTIIKDYIINIIVTILLLILSFGGKLLFNRNAELNRLSGFILIGICIIYIIYLIKTAKNQSEDSEDNTKVNILVSTFKIILGIIGIIIGGNLVVNSASNIAYSFGLSDKLVGLTIVAMGTSLPELVTSMIAALKGENDIAIGNVLGSNIFNILLILGVSSSINPIIIAPSLLVDILFLIIISLILGVFLFRGNKEKLRLGKIEGLTLVVLYIGYMAYIIFRN